MCIYISIPLSPPLSLPLSLKCAFAVAWEQHIFFPRHLATRVLLCIVFHVRTCLAYIYIYIIYDPGVYVYLQLCIQEHRSSSVYRTSCQHISHCIHICIYIYEYTYVYVYLHACRACATAWKYAVVEWERTRETTAGGKGRRMGGENP